MLAACAPVKIPAGPAVDQPKIALPEVTPPQVASTDGSGAANDEPVIGTLVTADGAELPMRAWLPATFSGRTKPKAILLGVHGFNDYSNAFDMPGRWWAKHGIATYAYDQRGFGQAPHPGYWAGVDSMAADLGQAARLLAARYPGVPLYYVGESMGASVVIAALARDAAPRPAGTILVAPAVWGRAYMPLYQRWALWTASHVTPWLRLTGRGLHIVASDNYEMLRAYSRDPLVIKATRADTINGLVNLMDNGVTAIDRLPGPALALIGAKDQVVPIKPQWAAIKKLPDPAHQRVAYYSNGWHMLLRDLEAKVVWADIAAWIADHDAALPSGADKEAEERLRDWEALEAMK